MVRVVRKTNLPGAFCLFEEPIESKRSRACAPPARLNKELIQFDFRPLTICFAVPGQQLSAVLTAVLKVQTVCSGLEASCIALRLPKRSLFTEMLYSLFNV
jgi:hypothetical protein